MPSLYFPSLVGVFLLFFCATESCFKRGAMTRASNATKSSMGSEQIFFQDSSHSNY